MHVNSITGHDREQAYTWFRGVMDKRAPIDQLKDKLKAYRLTTERKVELIFKYKNADDELRQQMDAFFGIEKICRDTEQSSASLPGPIIHARSSAESTCDSDTSATRSSMPAYTTRTGRHLGNARHADHRDRPVTDPHHGSDKDLDKIFFKNSR